MLKRKGGDRGHRRQAARGRERLRRRVADDEAIPPTAAQAGDAGSDGGSADGASTPRDRRTPKETDKRSDKDPTDDRPPSMMELDDDSEVDPVLLAKEFSGLLQVESGDDEATS